MIKVHRLYGETLLRVLQRTRRRWLFRPDDSCLFHYTKRAKKRRREIIWFHLRNHVACIGYWGIGITGYASPVAASGNKVFAYYTIVYKNKIKKKGIIRPPKQDPPDVQQYYVGTIIQKLGLLLK